MFESALTSSACAVVGSVRYLIAGVRGLELCVGKGSTGLLIEIPLFVLIDSCTNAVFRVSIFEQAIHIACSMRAACHPF